MGHRANGGDVDTLYSEYDHGPRTDQCRRLPGRAGTTGGLGQQALVLVANAAGVSNETTVLACNVYFWARVVHFLSYTFAIPWVRTLAFVVGWGCQVALILQLI